MTLSAPPDRRLPARPRYAGLRLLSLDGRANGLCHPASPLSGRVMVARALGIWCGGLGRDAVPSLETMRDTAGGDLWPHHFTARLPDAGEAATVLSDGGWLGALTGIEAAGRKLEVCAGPALWPAWSRAIGVAMDSGKPMPWVGRACRVADRTIDVDVLFLPVDDSAAGRTILLGFLKFHAVA